MPTHCIPYRDTGYFSDLIIDYLAQDKSVEFLYHRFPNLENYGEQIQEKTKNYPHDNRKILVDTLKRQYNSLNLSEATGNHIRNLENQNTFTITTGHQLNLYTGPLYFLYKIISTINLCNELKKKYPENNFVPVYWMATEDHDFDEINFFNFKERKVVWNRNSGGAVGELSTDGLQKIYETFSKELGTTPNAEKLKALFKEAYLNHRNLSDATRFLANALFGDYGLVILDGNDKELKKSLSPFIKDELFKNTSSERVAKTNSDINGIPGKNYKLQVNPREINLFYLEKDSRERIIERDEKFYINTTGMQFSKSQLEAEVENHPERFSPNVLMRPLYQEVVLPNLCYIGGGGELAYWLQLKSYFDEMKITFPTLLLRNSAVLASSKQIEKIKKMDLYIEDLFLTKHELETKVTKRVSEIAIDLTPQRNQLKQQFKDLYELAKQTDPTFDKMVAAQETKQLKGLDTLERRLLKAQKRKLADHLNRVTLLQNELFPNGSLQERTVNFSEFYMEYGEDLISTLFMELKPLEQKFQIIIL